MAISGAADRPWHRIPRQPVQQPDPPFGFRLEVPEAAFNLGELHNLPFLGAPPSWASAL